MCCAPSGASDSPSVTVTLLTHLKHCRFKSQAVWIMMLKRLMFPYRSYSFPRHMEAEQMFTANILCSVRSSHLSVKSAKCFPKSQCVITGSKLKLFWSRVEVLSHSEVLHIYDHLKPSSPDFCSFFTVFSLSHTHIIYMPVWQSENKVISIEL